MEKLREIRKKRGLTLPKLADMVGVTQFSIIRWERGTTSPTSEKLIALADALGVTPNDLLGVGETEKEEER